MTVKIPKKLGDGGAFIAAEGKRNSLRSILSSMASDLRSHETSINFGSGELPALADGTSLGMIKTQNAISYTLNGTMYTKAATDNLFDLSAETDLPTHIANGTTAGKLKATAAIPYFLAALQSFPITDDVWDLSAEVDTIGAQYRAYWLYLTAAGVASIGAGTNAASAVAALAALPAVPAGKIAVGTYVAGPSTDFNNAGGLSGQGTITEIQYKAYWLLLDSSGIASLSAGIRVTPSSQAVARLPVLDGTKFPVGTYVAGPKIDFNGGGGLAAQGTIADGIPSGYSWSFNGRLLTLVG